MANKRSKRNENAIPLRDLLFHCLSRWYWFIISLTVTLGLAVLYILSTPPAYVRYTEILIKENNNGGKGGDGLNNFASAQSTADAETEMLALRSPGIMKEVIDSLGLGIEYKTEGRFHDAVMYKSSPIAVNAFDLYENDNATFWAELNKNKTLKLYSFTKNGEELDGEVGLKIGDTIATPVGKIHVAATEHYNRFAGERVHVNRKGRNSVINEFCSRVKTEFVNEESSIVRLSIKDISNNRADDILRAITEIYNRQWIERNNGNIVKISEFIRQRIDSLQVELSLLDKEIAAFKSENKLTATKIEELNSEVNKIDNSRIIELNSQFELTKFVKKIVVENAGNKNILPANTGADIPGIEELITSYNQEIIKRDRYIENSSEANPLVADCNDKLNAMYKSINDAVDSHLENIRRSIALEEQKGTTQKVEFSKNTEQIKDAQGLLRQRKVKSALYMFLLQKLEETELSKEFEASNNRVLVPPTGTLRPVEPMQKQSIMLAIAVGLLQPLTIIFIIIITNRKVRGRKDLEEVNIPFLGEIPFNGKPSKKKKKGVGPEIIVKSGSRNVVNEAFRVLRTNLQFMNDKDQDSHVIAMTSFNPGSGKTFLSVNIAASLALKDAKVLVIDGDMRHGSTSEYAGSPENGLSDYLSGGVSDINDIIVNIEGHPNLDILPVGSIPPNPTELLHGDMFGELIKEMRKKYEYIFIDCPPIDIVADTQIIEEHTNRTLFVIRVGLLNRDMLDELEEMYDNKRFKNLSMILNGTYGGGGKYSYKYGYSYGYGYGYGYGYHYHSKK